MIQSHGFDLSYDCASELFHTFHQKSDMIERLLKGRRPEIIHLFSFTIVKITTKNTAVLPALQTMIYLIHASLISKRMLQMISQMYVLNFHAIK